MSKSTFEEQLDKCGKLIYTNVGDSMMPLIRQDKDLLIIEKPKGRLKKYDVPLYRRDSGQYVLHRILEVRKNDYVICVADGKSCASVEWDVNSTVALLPEPGEGSLVMSNHFVQPGWKNLPGAIEGGAESSVSRFNALRKLADGVQPGSADLETMKGFFSRGIAQGGSRCDGTLFTVLAVPAERKMLVKLRGASSWSSFMFDSTGRNSQD